MRQARECVVLLTDGGRKVDTARIGPVLAKPLMTNKNEDLAPPPRLGDVRRGIVLSSTPPSGTRQPHRE